QRQATKDAGKIAGLEIKRIINEPTAAALAYGLDQKKDQTVIVYDFGGGTFDVSILEIGDNVIEVLSTNGDTHLGGDDFDEIIIQWLLTEFKSDTGMDVAADKMVLQRLREAAEKAKIELSTAQQTEINLPFLTADATGPQHMQIVLTRSQYEKMIDSIVQSTLKPVKRALKDAGKKAADIDEVVLVGGSTRTPAIRNLVETFFDQEANKSVNPDEVVALGAAIQGGVFSGTVTDVLLLDVTPLSLGIETLGSVMTRLIERNTTIPCEKSEIFSTASDNQSAVDIHILQGEREMAEGNRTLGRFQLLGLPPAPRGVPQIEVKFEIDADGIVHVSARDTVTDKEQSIKIESGSAISDEEIEKMIADAEKFRDEDAQKRELIEKTNKLDSFTYQTETMLKDIADKLDEESKENIQNLLADARDAVSSGELEIIDECYQKLESAVSALTAQLYSQSVAPAPEETSTDDEVIEAEIEDTEMRT
ncbi:MAG TPA: molecular chaperone DnaK, partial [Candidatus Marinimicrobia bacterium]|nr:molecular chaperone DnaK [Candidatus Neomarinimicrobiota bacterium]